MDLTDLALFNKFMPSGHSGDTPLLDGNDNDGSNSAGVNLADLILEQIAAHEAGQQNQDTVPKGGPPEEAIELPAKVVEVYSKYSPIVNQVET